MEKMNELTHLLCFPRIWFCVQLWKVLSLKRSDVYGLLYIYCISMFQINYEVWDKKDFSVHAEFVLENEQKRTQSLVS